MRIGESSRRGQAFRAVGDEFHASRRSGDRRPFDEEAGRALVQRDVERARDFTALQNHDAIPDDDQAHQALASITAPALVIHGTADPMFPLRHGEELAAEIPGARLLPVEGAGHGVDRTDWGTIVAATVELTAAADRADGR